MRLYCVCWVPQSNPLHTGAISHHMSLCSFEYYAVWRSLLGIHGYYYIELINERKEVVGMGACSWLFLTFDIFLFILIFKSYYLANFFSLFMTSQSKSHQLTPCRSGNIAQSLALHFFIFFVFVNWTHIYRDCEMNSFIEAKRMYNCSFLCARAAAFLILQNCAPTWRLKWGHMVMRKVLTPQLFKWFASQRTAVGCIWFVEQGKNLHAISHFFFQLVLTYFSKSLLKF